MNTLRNALLLLFALSSSIVVSSAFADRLPLFDAHVHYSEDAWRGLTPNQAIAVLKRAGVRSALVSSTPDDGTRKLLRADAVRVIPFIRPYRSRGDLLIWPNDAAVRAYVEERLADGTPYRGVGEFHLSLEDVNAKNVVRFAAIAAEKHLFFHAHVDSKTMAALKQAYPRVRMLWAHAGLSEGAAASRALLDQYENLWIELSLRADVVSGDVLDPHWRALFLRYPDRFMVGTDTWIPSRWDELETNAEFTRGWLAQLPPVVAEKIAYRNGEGLFLK